MRGLVSADWVLGIAIFMLFAATGFVYYMNMAPAPAEPLIDTTDLIANKLLDYMLVDVYIVPMVYDSPGPEPQAVMYFDFEWPSGTQNSTQIFRDNTELPCIIQGNRIYWQSDLVTGANTFKMKMSAQETSPRCSGTFSLAGARQVIPFTQETEKMVSNTSVAQMVATDYYTFKTDQGINRDFRVTLNVSGNVTQYGRPPLNATNIYSKEKWKRVEENEQPVNLLVQVW